MEATPPNKDQTSHILNQAYVSVIQDSSTLNKYKGFSDQVSTHKAVSSALTAGGRCTAKQATP